MEPGSGSPPLAAFALVFATGLLIALVVTPLAGWLGRRLGLVAVPGGRRKHKGTIPRTGGIPLYLAFIGAVAVSQMLVVNPGDPAAGLHPSLTVVRFDPKEIIRLAGLLLGSTLIFVFGLIDDWLELPPLPQYLAQIMAAAVAVLFLIIIEYVNNPFSGQQTADFPYLLTVTISLFWLGLMMNTVNWLDGLDGLAVGVVAIASIVLFVNSVFRLQPPQDSVALLPMALLGASLGLLPYNFSPAKIFLGSAGAYFLGYVLGVLSIVGGAKVASILLVMGLPLLDTVWQIVNRVMRGQNPGEGDRGHLHFRLHDLGLSHRQIVLGYYFFCATFGGLALLIPSRTYKLVAIVVMAIIALIGFRWLALHGAPDPQPPDDDL